MAPAGATAVAETGTSDATVTTVPGVGAVMDTPGGAGVTVTFTADDVTATKLESVAVAVSATDSALAGIHETENGAVVSMPIETPFAKNCTLATLSGAPAVAVAFTFTAVPATREAEAAGALIETVGAATTVTAIAAEVALPFVSVTRAVIDALPVAVGVQVPV